MGTAVNLSLKHLFLVLLIVLIWGTNFIAVYVGLKTFPPFLLSAVRFGLSALPWVFFLPKPHAPLKFILGYGVFNFAMQFGFLFTGIHLGLSPGLASLLLQISVFFSMGLAFLFFKEKPSVLKVAGSLISFIGIGIVATHIDADATFIGLVLTLLAAFAWAAGNMFTKKVNAQSPLSLVVWGNLIAFPFMVLLSLVVEGPAVIKDSLQHTSWETIAAVSYIVYISTHIGYGAWGLLLKSYAASAVVPFTLLIPVVGFFSSAVVLGEDLPSWKLFASLFIMGGLVFGLLERQVRRLLPIKTNLTEAVGQENPADEEDTNLNRPICSDVGKG
ncbi:EamA family transporter [Pedobacter sp. SYSU D00535]|uniref:EamA family transporter n=1 Tax=Pedobacter sp. SYSU D00535 TaxID=2810308 RepID=UPI001A958660|nr:EamA family transporter [Pedobacter sp. SYSU D00535]